MQKQKAKPFVKWVGGKGQLISEIDFLLPENFSEINSVTYIEPFIGGGALLFHMLQKYPNIKSAIINDINPVLIAAYRVVRNSPESLIDSLRTLQSEYIGIESEAERKEYYLNIRRLFNSEGLSDMGKTVYFIFLNKTCFNGLYRVNSKGQFNVPFGKYANPKICDEETIRADSELLQKVEIINGDFEDTAKYIKNDTFVYFDPPYRPLSKTSSFNTYTKDGFGDEQQIRLKKYFDKLHFRNCWLMLSNSDGKSFNENDTFFDDLYMDYNIERIYASRAINSAGDKRGKIAELIIRNY